MLPGVSREESARYRVRIQFVANAPQNVREYLARHFHTAQENFERGLDRPDLESLFKSDCGYIAFEDFGTRGLTGDVNEWRLERAEKNAFFSFFRAEGRSAKSGDNLGRWGIGKQVFPTASRLHAIFGLTVRQESPDSSVDGFGGCTDALHRRYRLPARRRGLDAEKRQTNLYHP